MKIPFDIKYRPQIESGEYKVETRDGKPARILCWDKVDECGQYIVALVQYTHEHENIISVCEDGIYKGTYGDGYDLFIITPEPEQNELEVALEQMMYDWEDQGIEARKIAAQHIKDLRRLAREEIIKSGYAIVESDHYLEEGRKNYERGKEEALKDLPRWIPNKFDKHNFETCKAYLDTPRYLCYEDKMIDVSELVEKLPGFKEDDSHE